MSHQRVGDGIYAIDTQYIRPQLDASHLLVSAGQAAFIDTGVNAAVPTLMATLDALGLDPADVRYVLLTHIHLDHAGAAGQLMRKLPNATLVVHPRGARHMADPTRLIAGSMAVYGEALYRKLYGEIVPIDAERIQTTEDGDTLTVGERTLTFIHTAGHARHHHCIVDRDNKLVFTGDSFGVSYRPFDVDGRHFIFPTTTPVHFDPEAAHVSLDRILSFAPEVAYLTHYSRVEGLPELAEQLHADIDAFVEMTAEASAAADPQAALVTAMTAYLNARMDAHGVAADPALRETWLSLDVPLNAQGLLFWWEHRR